MPMTDEGYQTLTADAIITGIQQAYKNTFGNNFVTNPNSINGACIQYDANMAIQVENSKALLYGSLYNPYQTNGIWLDSLCKFNNIKRKEATPSVVRCTVTGLRNTVIPKNSAILNTNGNKFINLEPIIIGATPTDSEWVSVELGAIPCFAHSLTRIVQTVSGWDSVDNPNDGILGTVEESDQELIYRREYSLAINSAGSINSIISALYNLSGVINFAVLENYEPIAQVIYGVTIQPNSIYLSVYAPDTLDDEIAKILFTKLYANMQGDFSHTIFDAVYPWVSFTAKWNKPIVLSLYIQINLPAGKYQADIDTKIKNSVLDNFYGKQPPVPAYRMTAPVDSSQFYYALNIIGIIRILSVKISIDGNNWVDELNIPANQVLTLISDHIIINIS